MFDVIVNATEARDEARRLTKVHGRDVTAITRDCCDYVSSCGCGGQGYRFILVFDYCAHEVGDGTGIECDESDCRAREHAAQDSDGSFVDPFAVKPLKGIAESVEEMELTR